MFILYFASSTTLRTKLYPRIQTKNISYRKSFDLAERIDETVPLPSPNRRILHRLANGLFFKTPPFLISREKFPAPGINR